MARSDAEQCDRGPLRLPPALFPVAERVNADAHGAGELGLREPHEAPQGRDVVTRFESVRSARAPRRARRLIGRVDRASERDDDAVVTLAPRGARTAPV